MTAKTVILRQFTAEESQPVSDKIPIYFPPLKRGIKGDLLKIIYKISPNPSLKKRGVIKN
jgi:hypothetical protein